MKKYKKIYTEKDGKWFVSHFPLLGLSAQGGTKKRAESNLVEAVGLSVVEMLGNNSVDIFIEEMRKIMTKALNRNPFSIRKIMPFRSFEN